MEAHSTGCIVTRLIIYETSIAELFLGGGGVSAFPESWDGAIYPTGAKEIFGTGILECCI